MFRSRQAAALYALALVSRCCYLAFNLSMKVLLLRACCATAFVSKFWLRGCLRPRFQFYETARVKNLCLILTEIADAERALKEENQLREQQELRLVSAPTCDDSRGVVRPSLLFVALQR